MRSILRRSFVSAVMAAVMIVLIACTTLPPQTSTPSPLPTATPTPRATPGSQLSEEAWARIRETCRTQSAKGRAQQGVVPPGQKAPPYRNLIYVQDRVILTGEPTAIALVTARVWGKSIEPLDRIALSAMPSDTPLSREDLAILDKRFEAARSGRERLPDDAKGQSQLVVDLYPASTAGAVEQTVCEVNAVAAALKAPLYADPDYHFSPAPGWAGGGSPWTQNGQWPGVKGGGLAPAQQDRFWTQWGFRDANGIALMDAAGKRQVKQTGKGIRIAVFDTSPFGAKLKPDEVCTDCLPFRDLMAQAMGPSYGQAQQALDGRGTFTIWQRAVTPAPNCPGGDREKGGKNEQDVSNHGLFVASLAHAVAPDSDVYLIRVLEDDGCGDLWSIVGSIVAFSGQTAKERGSLKGTVLNLSLGVHEPPYPELYGLPREVVALETTLRMATRAGAVVVAAAGNDSFSSPEPQGAEKPAAYPFVVGVAASNIAGERGCFSNQGSFAAPGGDGANRLLPRPAQYCVIPKCDDSNSKACVVGLAYKPKPGFAYWLGSSFATPLVSGSSALLLEHGVSSARVFDALNPIPGTGADGLGQGILSLPATVP